MKIYLIEKYIDNYIMEIYSNNKTILPDDVIKAMENYYKLKAAYTSKVENLKDTIKKNKRLNTAQKKQRMQSLAPKCINCNKPVGTIFLNKNRKLIAKCGATNFTNSQYKPCSLNIEIDKGKVERKDILYEIQKENINISTLTIIKLKLDLIFKYLSEEETLEKFDEIISEYETESHLINSLTEEMIQINNKLSNKSRIEAIKNENENHFTFMKNSLETYKETNEPTIITDILQTYINNIVPNIHEFRQLQYDYYTIETEDNKEFKLIKRVNNISSMEHILEDAQVISNTQ